MGLGYVGEPLVHALASRGFKVVGIDKNPDRVRELAASCRDSAARARHGRGRGRGRGQRRPPRQEGHPAGEIGGADGTVILLTAYIQSTI